MENVPSRAAIKRALNAKGISTNIIINTLLNMDSNTFSSLSENNIRKAIKKLMPEVKRRIKEFGKDASPAVEKFQRSGGKFALGKQDLTALRTEFMRIKMFLDSKTSTKAGWTETQEKTLKTMKELGLEFTKENFSDVWKAYSLLLELDKSISAKEFKYLSLRRIIELQGEGKSTYEIATEVHEDFERLYKRHKMAQGEEDFYSRYYSDEWLL